MCVSMFAYTSFEVEIFANFVKNFQNVPKKMAFLTCFLNKLKTKSAYIRRRDPFAV